MALKRLIQLKLATQCTAILQLFFIIGVLVYTSVETWDKSVEEIQNARLSFNVVGFYTAIFGLVGLFTCVELYTYCFNLMKYWIIAIVTAIYVFGTIMSIFGFVVCLLIFTENKLDDDGIIPRQKETRIFWEGEQRQSMSKKECEFLLLFLVCLGSLALILTCRIVLAFYGIKAHRNETMRTFRAIRNVEVTFDLSHFPPNSQIPADVNSIAASNPPTYSDCVKEDSSDNLPRYSDLRIV